MKEFTNKTAVITGGASGIGRSTALALVAKGANIVIADMNGERGAQTVADIEAMGGKAVFHLCDVTDEAAVAALRDLAIATFGGVHILMNNVGTLPVGGFQDIPLAAWERTFAINVFSYVRCTQTFLPDLIAAGEAHIVNTASAAGVFAYDPKAIAYAASKAAVISLSENLALTLRPYNIGVTCLCPGAVITNIVEQIKPFGDPSGLGAYATANLAARTPEEVAAMVVGAIEDRRFLLHTDEKAQDILRDRANDQQGFLDHMGAFLDGFA
jgi:NAD(P)-dependent dehydrogenase (short-subunit alcohol dehydrogenase family)